jgi:hypothetical protein
MGSPGSALALEPISGNSLTSFIRSVEGLTGTQGQSILNQGLQQEQQGVTAAAPALQLLTQLTKGDQGEVTQAAQPEIDQITQQFDQIRNMISLQPRGGGKTTALAEAPFQKAGDIQRAEGAMRTNAAGQLGGLATNLAGLGLSTANLGSGLETESANIALTKEGQDYSQPSALQQVLSGLQTGADLAQTGAGISYLLH